ncbi:hypothetical protein cyc_07576 [Cyclospora cayetanensis]|uniref:Uncharacterized protein n=1 Tax=Cyclospora cayetanensis TaxID=88456 RepID=A0A1D3CV33_9EIME|nr:hypothetical protein cyc_07576 [Cyclospora cayetanensis]
MIEEPLKVGCRSGTPAASNASIPRLISDIPRSCLKPSPRRDPLTPPPNLDGSPFLPSSPTEPLPGGPYPGGPPPLPPVEFVGSVFEGDAGSNAHALFAKMHPSGEPLGTLSGRPLLFTPLSFIAAALPEIFTDVEFVAAHLGVDPAGTVAAATVAAATGSAVATATTAANAYGSTSNRLPSPNLKEELARGEGPSPKSAVIKRCLLKGELPLGKRRRPPGNVTKSLQQHEQSIQRLQATPGGCPSSSSLPDKGTSTQHAFTGAPVHRLLLLRFAATLRASGGTRVTWDEVFRPVPVELPPQGAPRGGLGSLYSSHSSNPKLSDLLPAPLREAAALVGANLLQFSAAAKAAADVSAKGVVVSGEVVSKPMASAERGASEASAVSDVRKCEGGQGPPTTAVSSKAAVPPAELADNANIEVVACPSGVTQEDPSTKDAPGAPGMPVPLPLSLEDPWAAFEASKEAIEAMAAHCRLTRPTSATSGSNAKADNKAGWELLRTFRDEGEAIQFIQAFGFRYVLWLLPPFSLCDCAYPLPCVAFLDPPLACATPPPPRPAALCPPCADR